MIEWTLGLTYLLSEKETKKNFSGFSITEIIEIGFFINPPAKQKVSQVVALEQFAHGTVFCFSGSCFNKNKTQIKSLTSCN